MRHLDDIAGLPVAAALRSVTETLAARLGARGAVAISWSEFEWRIAAAVCGLHGIAALLHQAGGEFPQGFRRFLEAQRGHASARHRKIDALLGELDAAARAAGVPLIALKGAALYGRGVYAAGLRPMGDVDLLVRERDLQAMAPLLDACGYAPLHANGRHEVFRPRAEPEAREHGLGEHIDNPVKIEVHARIAEALPVETVDVTRFVMPRDPAPGINAYPSDAALLAHLVLHAAGNMRARALRMIQIQDIARLARGLAPADWHEAIEAGALGWWAWPPLRLAARYHGELVPPEIALRLSAMCPRRLRRHAERTRICAVSWSQIRIEAFPGIEWSRRIGDTCRYMRSRIAPSKAALRELRTGAEQIPGAAAVPWYGVSHASRIARWLLAKPPRVQTLLSVRAALADFVPAVRGGDGAR